VKRLALLGCALVLAGCGGGGRVHGTATLWVTHDRGTHVVFAGPVPAGLNGIQTVERKLKVTTRYGGRFVESIAGTAGSLGAQRDWFFYVNGIEGNTSAADVRLKPGDVLWWDYRHWTGSTMDIPVVAGAYPQPFLSHGGATVKGPPAFAKPIAKQVRGTLHGLGGRNEIVIDASAPPDAAQITSSHGFYVLRLGPGVAARLAKNPHALRYRF
jgi:hypothetical protein